MTRLLLTSLGVLLCGAAAHAQFSRPGLGGPGASLGTPGGLGGGFSPGLGGGIGNSQGTPSFSPYLNITRGGNSAAQNYYGIVRPQQAFAASLQGLQQQVTGGQNGAGADDPLSQGITVGTRARFLNTGGFFQNINGGTTTGTATGGGLGGMAQGNNRPNITSVGGYGNQNLRGGFGSGGGNFGTGGTSGATRGPR